MKTTGMTLVEATQFFKHEGRRIRRKGESDWCEVHNSKMIRMEQRIDGTFPRPRTLTLEDALAADWEGEEPAKMLTASQIREAMLKAIHDGGTRRLSPMEYLNMALNELGMI